MTAKKPLGLYAGDVEGFTNGDFIDILYGGTGGANKLDAYNNLSPLTTKGDVIVYTGTSNVRQAVGVDGSVLVADSTQTNGVKWAVNPSVGGRSFLLMGA